jgi:hypothetical protein
MPKVEELEGKAAPSPILAPVVTGADQPPRPQPDLVIESDPINPSTPTSGPVGPRSS